MKKRFFALALVLTLLLGGCAAAPAQSGGQEAGLRVVATTYPVYQLVCAAVGEKDTIAVEHLSTGETSCLHDYTLSVSDMKKLEGADLIVMSGAGLEEFLEDALAASQAAVVDCSVGVELLENLSHHHDDHDHSHHGHDHGHWDPHYWMDPRNAQLMLDNIAAGLIALDPAGKEDYEANMLAALAKLESLDSTARDMLAAGQVQGADLSGGGLITFHDGFQYFAHAYDLPLLASIEEEAGSEASAKEILEITELVRERDIPVIFTEVNGSEATARAIARETGCAVAQLSMCMDGPEEDNALDAYCTDILGNVAAVVNGFAEREGIILE